MHSTKRIFVATDFSESSDEALRQAHRTSLVTGAKIAVCHVLPDLLRINTLFPQRNESAVVQAASIEAKIRDVLSSQIARCMPRVEVEMFVILGVDYAEIVRSAENWAADLIVVGNAGRSGVSSHLGHVAELVTRHAHCATLVARPTTSQGAVLVATDLSDPAMPAVAAGAEQARLHGAKLVVMHAIDFASVAVSIEEIVIDMMKSTTSWNLDDEVRRLIDEHLGKALTRCEAVGETMIVQGSAASAIVSCADQLNAQLLVVGTRGRTGLVRLLLGSVAERVIRTAACPVLAVRLVH
ncbi:MAG: universal stress protein [Polyangiaceae bacterium]